MLDRRRRPLERPPRRVVGKACCRGAYLRGALLGGGSLSGPRSPHLEARTTGVEGARFLAEAVARRRRRATRARAAHRMPPPTRRAIEAIAGALALAGASDAALAFEERAVVGETRSIANRLANADHANLVRTSRAAHRQLRGDPAARPRRPAGRRCARSPSCGVRHPSLVAARARRHVAGRRRRRRRSTGACSGSSGSRSPCERLTACKSSGQTTRERSYSMRAGRRSSGGGFRPRPSPTVRSAVNRRRRSSSARLRPSLRAPAPAHAARRQSARVRPAWRERVQV